MSNLGLKIGQNLQAKFGVRMTGAILLGTFAGAVLVVAPGDLAAGGAPALQCRDMLKVTGGAAEAGTHAELQARHNAIENWRSQVTDRHGDDYAHWWRARDKDVTCRAGSAGFKCEALAAPCMTEGGSTSASAPYATRSGLGMSGATR